MFRELSSKGVKVPNGFAITADAYRHFLGWRDSIGESASFLPAWIPASMRDLCSARQPIRQAILAAPLPSGPASTRSRSAYRDLVRRRGGNVDVAVRSSATAEDLPDASFAGQQETYLNVQGEQPLLDACRRCFASLFTDRAISYRVDKGFDHFKIALSIGVQRMVRSDLATSGRHVLDRHRNRLSRCRADQRRLRPGRERRAGLGQSGRVLRLQADAQAGLSADPQEARWAPRNSSWSTTSAAARWSRTCRCRRKIAADSPSATTTSCTLARWAVPDRRSLLAPDAASPRPMDMEWAKDGRTGELFIVQARPETVQSQREVARARNLSACSSEAACWSRGAASARRSAEGAVRVIRDVQHLRRSSTAKCWSPTRPIPTGSRS